MYKTVKNSRKFAVPVKYKNAAGEEVETSLDPDGTVDVSEDQEKDVERQVTDAPEPLSTDTNPEPAPSQDEQQALLKNIGDMVSKAMQPITAKVDAIEQNAFNKSVDEPKFVKNGSSGVPNVKNELAAMDWRERTGAQINAGWAALKGGDPEGWVKLRKINEFNLGDLKKEGMVSNTLTMTDFGNYIIPREMLTEMYGVRTNYSDLVNATTWRETLSTQMAWISRVGDIDMQSVEFCDDGANGNLKPISEYGASVQTSDLEELAAVTPVCNAATRFLAVDLLSDVAAGYRNDYDRKRAQLVVARLEQAVEANPAHSVTYDTSTNVEAMINLLDAWEKIAETTPNGTFVFNNSTYAQIVGRALRAGVTGPLSQLFTTGDQPRLFGRPYIVVANDLLPTLDVAAAKTFVVNGVTVTVNHAVFYADLSNFTGRVSGGLQYDLSTEASYEDAGTVKSAYQRNELVLRGSFFRGGAVLDNTQVAGIRSPGVS